MVLTTWLRRKSFSGESRGFTISRITSRGVKCSPASSFACSSPMRIASPSCDVLHSLRLELAVVPRARAFRVQLLCNRVATNSRCAHLPNPHHYCPLCVVLVGRMLTVRPATVNATLPAPLLLAGGKTGYRCVPVHLGKHPVDSAHDASA